MSKKPASKKPKSKSTTKPKKPARKTPKLTKGQLKKYRDLRDVLKEEVYDAVRAGEF